MVEGAAGIGAAAVGAAEAAVPAASLATETAAAAVATAERGAQLGSLAAPETQIVPPEQTQALATLETALPATTSLDIETAIQAFVDSPAPMQAAENSADEMAEKPEATASLAATGQSSEAGAAGTDSRTALLTENVSTRESIEAANAEVTRMARGLEAWDTQPDNIKLKQDNPEKYRKIRNQFKRDLVRGLVVPPEMPAKQPRTEAAVQKPVPGDHPAVSAPRSRSEQPTAAGDTAPLARVEQATGVTPKELVKRVPDVLAEAVRPAEGTSEQQVQQLQERTSALVDLVSLLYLIYFSSGAAKDLGLTQADMQAVISGMQEWDKAQQRRKNEKRLQIEAKKAAATQLEGKPAGDTETTGAELPAPEVLLLPAPDSGATELPPPLIEKARLLLTDSQHTGEGMMPDLTNRMPNLTASVGAPARSPIPVTVPV